MHGNVWEWVGKVSNYSSADKVDPGGNGVELPGILRGGSYTSYDLSTITWNAAKERPINSDYLYSDIGFRLALRDVNKVPSDLNFTSPLTISENQPAGTVVADFNATDTSDDVLSFRLIHGLGDGNNSAFSINDSTGELSTAQVFDYEVDGQSLAIRIRVTDSHGFYIENNFTVSLTNVVEDVDGDGTEDHYDDNIDGDAFSNSEEYEVGTDAYDPQSYPLDFIYGYKHVLESDVEDYVVYSNSIKTITEWQTVPNTYWSPKTGGYEGQMVYHFPFEEPVTDLFLKANLWGNNEGSGFTSIQFSHDGIHWQTYSSETNDYNGSLLTISEIVESAAGRKNLWVKVNLKSNTVSTSSSAQHSRSNADQQSNIFEVNARYGHRNAAGTRLNAVDELSMLENQSVGTLVGSFQTFSSGNGCELYIQPAQWGIRQSIL